MGGTSQALEPSSKWSKREGMAGDKRSLALESEAGSIESAEEEGGTCSGEGHRVDGLVGGEAQDGTKCAEDGVVAALEEVGADVGGEDTHKVLEAPDARDLEDAECCMRVAVGKLGDNVKEAVVTRSNILEVAGDVVGVVGGVPWAAEATLKAGPLLDGGGGKAPRGQALVRRHVGRWGQAVRHRKGFAAASDRVQSNDAQRVVKGVVKGGEVLWLKGNVDVVDISEGRCFGSGNRAEPPDDGGHGDAEEGRAKTRLQYNPSRETYGTSHHTFRDSIDHHLTIRSKGWIVAIIATLCNSIS